MQREWDKTYSLVDFKFGQKFKEYGTSKFFKHGLGSQRDILETAETKSKVEQMIRAMILKTEYPEIQFNSLIVN